ncbi:Rpn family recombination-promoting nuclease/putative transposase [Desulfonema magnum]|uniref:Transposase, RpnA/YhgA-like n=1 Tax=Desulfonema magnum TaxID=45655 RepID=A0A975BIX6_9BACT|nr:Rpn family recombination-promoting nuclease/putative transposase [Desulfonema magnum]QTA86181.1 Putative transposase, RpnA/YhgA-like [Desulfonema magnum]
MRQITNIHDKFFQETFTRQEIAKSFLRHYLPKSLLSNLDMRTLNIIKDSFIDRELREHFSDILYTARFRNTDLYIYLLFEHKSYRENPEALQILRYKVRIWEQYVKKHPKARKVPPTFSMLLYHGKSRWTVSRKFQTIVEQSNDRLLKKYVPEFRYKLCDISHLPDDKIRGDVLGRIVLLVAKYVFRPDLREKLPQILSLFHAVADRRTAFEILEVLLRYVVRATEKFDENDIREIVEQSSIGEDIMQTFIDKYISQEEIRLLLRLMEARFGKLPPVGKGKN